MMKKRFFKLFITFVSGFIVYPALATHFAGYEFSYEFIGASAGKDHYRFSLSVYQDSTNALPVLIADDNPAYLMVFDGGGAPIQLDTANYSSTVSIPRPSTSSCSGITASPFRIAKTTFVADFFLPSGSSGYTITYQRCCAPASIVNIPDPGNLGFTAVCKIPSSGLVPHNTSAVFTNSPAFLTLINTPLTFDCSATDADGDSLSYSLCTAIAYTDPTNAKPIPHAPPYDTIVYVSPYSFSYPMSSSPALTIDPVTGMLSGTPNKMGTYMVSVCCHEWRSGKLINTTQRVFEYIVVNCNLGAESLATGSASELYPSPASGEITITSPGKITSVIISNMLGLVVFSNKYNANKTAVDVSGFPKGLYFVKINGSEMKTFVKE